MTVRHDSSSSMRSIGQDQTVWLRRTFQADDEGSPGCWLGGLPTLPKQFDWPFYKPDDGIRVPMHFVAQIDLSQVPFAFAQTGLPETGTLFFFYDTISAPTGPMGKDAGKVIYCNQPVENVAPRSMPPIPEGLDPHGLTFWWAHRPTHGYKRWNLILTDDPDIVVAPAKPGLLGRILGTPEAEFPQVGAALHHNMLAGPRSPTHAQILDERVPLLTVHVDDAIGFEHASGAIVFYLSPEDLIEQNFDAVSIEEGDS